MVGWIGAAVWAAEPTRHRDYWYVPTRQPIPAPLKEAGRLEAAIARDDAAWQAEMDKINALIDLERPDQFNLCKEVVTTEALRRYVEKLLRLGESAVVSMERMKKTARELEVLLKDAPARYRETAAMVRRYAEEEPYADIKENYRKLADIYEAKANAAELHRGDLQENLNGHFEEHLKRENVFLERLLTLLTQGLAVNELREVAEFKKTLEEVSKGHEYLRGVLKTWRERMVSKPVPEPGA